MAQASVLLGRANWQLTGTYGWLYYRFCFAQARFFLALMPKVKAGALSLSALPTEGQSYAELSPHGLPEPHRREKGKKTRSAARGRAGPGHPAIVWRKPLPTPLLESKRGRRPGRPATHRQATREICPLVHEIDKSDLAGKETTTPVTRRRPWTARPSTRRSAPSVSSSRPSGRPCRAGTYRSPRCSAGRGATAGNP